MRSEPLTISFSFFSLFEIQSSGRTNQLRVIYRALSSDVVADQMSVQAVETLSVNLADNQWHKLAITFSGNQILT